MSTSTTPGEHLTPELFIDVLEKSPVDSRWRQHLASCQECAGELGEIEAAMALVREPEGRAVSRRPWLRLAAAAAVLLGLGLGLARYAVTDRSPVETAADGETMLPPLGDDEDFALLMALSGALAGDSLMEALDESAPTMTAPMAWELYELTPDERDALFERLAAETEGGPGS